MPTRTRVSKLEELAPHLGELVWSNDPVGELGRRGIDLDDAISSRVAEASKRDPLGPALRARLISEFASQPPIRFRVAPQPALARTARDAGGFDLAVTAWLNASDAVFDAFFAARVYPHELPGSLADGLLDLPFLRQHCNGVPADPDARIATLVLLTAPRVVAPPTPGTTAAVVQPFRLVVGAAVPAALDAVATVRFPLTFDVSADDTLRVATGPIINETSVALEVAATSAIQPRSPADREALEADIADKLGLVLAQFAAEELKTSALRPVPGSLTNTTIRVDSAAVHFATSGGLDRVAAGITASPVGGNPTPHAIGSADDLAQQADPRPPANVRLAMGETFLDAVLTSAVHSGDLAKSINEKLAEALDPFKPVPIVVRSAASRLEQGLVIIGLKCVAKNACPFGVDLDFRLNLTFRTVLFEGQLRFETVDVDVDLDNTDAVVCTLLSVLLGPFAVTAYVIGLIIVAAISPSFTKTVDGFLDGERLPGTEVSPHVDYLQVTTQDGRLLANGVFSLVPDVVSTFVYIRVVEQVGVGGPFGGPPGLRVTRPVEDARVDLLELDDPAPAGDDVDIPPTDFSQETFGKFIEVTTTREYVPRRDQVLGTATTDSTGLARFAVSPNRLAGVHTTTVTRENLRTGKTTHRVTHDVVAGDAPDLAVKVTMPNGRVALERRLLSLNLEGQRAGSPSDPIVVVAPGLIPPIQG
jgi:hypothetical protein